MGSRRKSKAKADSSSWGESERCLLALPENTKVKVLSSEERGVMGVTSCGIGKVFSFDQGGDFVKSK
jgi:hypothetical protein